MEAIGLSNEMLKKALWDGLYLNCASEDDIDIISAKFYHPANKGVNLLSDLFHVTVTFAVKTKEVRRMRSVAIVVKVEPMRSKSSLQIVQQQDLFLTELRMLRDVLPKIENILEGEIGPRLLYGSSNPKLLIMEDLSNLGFVMLNREDGLPFHHCLLAIRQLARLHAASVALFEQNPELVSSFRGGILSSKCPKYFLRLIDTSLINVSLEVEKWADGNSENIAKKLRKLSETAINQCMDVYKYEPGEFCVLNHGDCWTNNMMFKRGKWDEVEDIRLVDFQMSVYTSPAIDLLYFLNTCPELSIKCEKDDFFLEAYIEQLKFTMKNIGCKTSPPTMQQLKKAMYKRRAYAVFAGIVLHLRMIADAEDTEDLDKLFVELKGETKMNVFKNPWAIKAARKMLLAMDERGYLD